LNTVTCSAADGLGNSASQTINVYYRPDVVFVRKGASGAKNGTSWADAYPEVSTAMKDGKVGSIGTQIWVSKGTYLAPAGGFIWADGLSLYGGFGATGTPNNLSQRDTLTEGVTTLQPATIAGDQPIVSIAVVSASLIKDAAINGVLFNGWASGDAVNIGSTENFKFDNCNFSISSPEPILIFGTVTFKRCNFHDNNAGSNNVIYIGLNNIASKEVVFETCQFYKNTFGSNMITFSSGGKVTFRNSQLNDDAVSNDTEYHIHIMSRADWTGFVLNLEKTTVKGLTASNMVLPFSSSATLLYNGQGNTPAVYPGAP
jgi:hypothetical protein